MYLPISERSFKAKYLMRERRGKSFRNVKVKKRWHYHINIKV
ncbi:MAG: hypothetical protein ACTS4W_01820 [Candidatus Hodgkinia cicadicola]